VSSQLQTPVDHGMAS